MFFRKKPPKRLYYPVKSNWYTRPRRQPSVKRPNRVFRSGIGGLKKYLKKSIHLVIVACAFSVLMLFFLFSSYFSIKSIEVVRANLNIDSASIENALNIYIGRNIIFFSRSNIYQAIQKKFPEFASVEVHKILPSTIKINLVSQQIVANLRAYYILPDPEQTAPQASDTELNKAIDELSGSDSALAEPKTPNPLIDEKVTKPAFTLDEGTVEKKPIEQKCLLNSIGQAIFDQEENLELMTVTIRGLTQPVTDREQVIPVDHMSFISESIKYFTNSLSLEVISVEYLPVAREIHLKTKNNMAILLTAIIRTRQIS
jgi:hypothetical protein